ncbi:hypothetical protein DFQ14_11096 [Halopolyspora algeriensis]|uniref:Uncharacterized protein n=1 Tax=Halopolyspora algeriensis TaxID=1500506 RepID=A0A368VHA6_9ACTN|nr:hypothetical protein [Halopolyspora algeriensis]RCW40769.1 hypothetical protein DFQ14_11096 [Halopolyspora algeriensis]TQM53312.1 hypothetical protein FHU43_2702 [Halopolyspora algeriensis]
MHDPADWRRSGKHWHAYSEIRQEQGSSTRVDRLAREPDEVLRNPRDVARWLTVMSREHSPRIGVKLLGENAGWGHVGDSGHLDHDRAADEIAAARGDSVHVSISREHDRVDLWVEAVTVDDCPEGHHEQE